MSVYLATFTTFVDDYKLRGRDPSDASRRVFKTKAAARKFICAQLAEEIVSCVDMDEIDELMHDNDFAAVFEHDAKTNSLRVKAGMETDTDALDTVAERYRDGEFVPARWDWDIEEIALDGLE